MLRDHRGVKGAKPRLKLAKEELPELSREYLRIRNQQMQTKNLSAEMMLAERRGELIEKRLVDQQAAYLLVVLRQRILAVPHAYARRILNITDPRQAKEILREAMVGLLDTIKDLPNAATDPNWLDTLEGDGPPSQPVEAKKVSKRR